MYTPIIRIGKTTFVASPDDNKQIEKTAFDLLEAKVSELNIGEIRGFWGDWRFLRKEEDGYAVTVIFKEQMAVALVAREIHSERSIAFGTEGLLALEGVVRSLPGVLIDVSRGDITRYIAR